MKGEIELINTNPQGQLQIDNFQQSKKKPEQVKKHSTVLYGLVCACEFIKIFLSIFLLVEPEHKKYVYLTYIIFTFVRVAVFAVSSVYLVGFGKKILKLYSLLDPTMLLQLASSLTYIFLNYRSTVEYAIEAIICYPFLLFFLVGNFRVMLKYFQWTRCKVIIYKMIKMIGSLYFMMNIYMLLIILLLINKICMCLLVRISEQMDTFLPISYLFCSNWPFAGIISNTTSDLITKIFEVLYFGS